MYSTPLKTAGVERTMPPASKVHSTAGASRRAGPAYTPGCDGPPRYITSLIGVGVTVGVGAGVPVGMGIGVGVIVALSVTTSAAVDCAVGSGAAAAGFWQAVTTIAASAMISKL